MMNSKPWLVPSAIEWLEHYLTKWMSAFEWGMGSSTLWYAKRVQRLVSIEHDSKWYQETLAELKRLELLNVIARLVDLESQEYVQAINQFSEYDYIAVDGRRRVECIQVAMQRLKPGGVLLLDNSERAEYVPGMELVRDWKHISFFEEWQTTVWVKP